METMCRTWQSFVSTSKNRKIAEIRGNTLFIITIVNIQYSSVIHACDVSEISYFPLEEEVLLFPGTPFRVMTVEVNFNRQNIIEIKI